MGLPKGNLMNKLGPRRTALQEAYEEAGILGTIVDQKLSKKVREKKWPSIPWKLKTNFLFGLNRVAQAKMDSLK